jgi:hypothetical protein
MPLLLFIELGLDLNLILCVGQCIPNQGRKNMISIEQLDLTDSQKND